MHVGYFGEREIDGFVRFLCLRFDGIDLQSFWKQRNSWDRARSFLFWIEFYFWLL